MQDYGRLKEALLGERRDGSVTLSLHAIERILGFKLPEAAREPKWWTNHPEPKPAGQDQCQAWLEAGFTARLAARRAEVIFTPTTRRTRFGRRWPTREAAED